MKALGLSASDPNEPRGSALAASLIAGVVVGAVFWFLISREVAVVLVVLSAIQGIIRELLTARAEPAPTSKKSRSRSSAKKTKKKRKR